VLGVTLAVALIESLDRQPLPFHVEVVGFSEEEGVRFGLPFIGSRAFCGTLDAEALGRADGAGRTVANAIRAFGLDPDHMEDAAAHHALGYVEFHIEQGPVLERLDAPVGCVNVIVGQTRGRMTFTGRSGHAGTTPMRDRHDALAGAAEWITAIEQEARTTAGLAATVGRIEVEPGASNVIAGWCRASLDVRHEDDVLRENAMGELQERARTIAMRRGLTISWDETLDQNAVRMNPDLVARLEQATRDAGFPVHRLASGAGHDAMIVAAAMPAAMLFIRTPGGISHHPDESVDVTDVSAALQVGRRFVEDLARSAT